MSDSRGRRERRQERKQAAQARAILARISEHQQFEREHRSEGVAR